MKKYEIISRSPDSVLLQRFVYVLGVKIPVGLKRVPVNENGDIIYAGAINTDKG